MPRGDGTGPMGRAAKDGLGLGSGYKRGLGRNFTKNQIAPKTQKELLQEQKELLQSKLDNINKQLESL